MDEMKLKDGILTSLLSKILTKLIKKKLGYDVDVILKHILVSGKDNQGKITVDLGMSIETDSETLTKLVKDYI